MAEALKVNSLAVYNGKLYGGSIPRAEVCRYDAPAGWTSLKRFYSPPGWKPGYHGAPDPLQVELRDRHQIEIPVGSWNGRRFLRVSAHLYTTQADMERLLAALSAVQLRL